MKSRIENSAKNFIANAGAQIVAIILNLFSRKVFIRTLGEDYLGINGLFSNIITVLSLAELGIGTAIVYSMYAPIAEGNKKKISALVWYYRNLYIAIALIIAAMGLAFYPFLDFFINLDTNIPQIKYYYFLFLIQTVSSYLIVYRTSVLTADQKGYLITKNNIIGNFITVICQIIVLIITHSYGLYTITQIIVGLTINYINSRAAIRNYPYIKEKYTLLAEEKKNIWANIKSMFSYKVGSVILNNTDNLLISKLISTTLLGFYSNYSMLISKVSGMVALIFTSIQSSLGNYNAETKGKDMYAMFKIISFIEYWVYGFCSIAFCILANDFITLWIGEKYVLSNDILYVCVLNFYIQGVLYPIWCYRNTTGLFKDTRFMMYFAAAINLMLSIFLGLKLGLFGILISTAVARLCTNLWYEPYILFKKYFHLSVSEYYLKELCRFIKIAVFISISNYLFSKIPIVNIFALFCIKTVYCILIPNVLLWAENRKSKEYSYLYKRIAALINERRKL